MQKRPYTLHLIGNAHIDPVWLWPWQEGYHETHATFRSALDRMTETPDFVFTASSAALYAWVEENDPTMFAEIQERVREGRWQISGGWWIEPDCNIPSGESFARQGLYGQRYFQRAFGRTAKVGYTIDSFGHAGTLPQILQKSGLPYYIFMRPGPHEKSLPTHLFWWESADGSRVLAFRILHSYASWGDHLRQHVENIAAELTDAQPELMCFYGVGNHGGGPTKENLNTLAALQNNPDLPTLIFSSPETYFATVAQYTDGLPVVQDDLQHHASGCYSAHSGVKKWNRTAENHLLAAEKFSALASWVTEQPYSDEFGRAWRSLLFNQFHDILAGTSLPEAYEDVRDQIGETMSIADRALNRAVQSLTWQIHVPAYENSLPLVVFNPHAWPVRANVEIEASPQSDDRILLNDQDQPIAFQYVQSHSTTWNKRLSFIAELPALGYRVYRLAQHADPHPQAEVTASQTSLENNRFRLEFDPRTGDICSLRDKTNGLEVFARGAAVPVVIEDDSDTWSHNVLVFDKVVGRFTAQSVELVEHGPVKAVIRVISQYNQSTITQDFALFAERDEIEVSVMVDWHEHQKMLKLRFPVKLEHIQATYEIAFGHIQRPTNGEEEPGQSWVDVSGVSAENGRRYGFSLLNDAKYSYDVKNDEVGLTVLRSPIYAHHMPAEPQPGKRYQYMDQGVQTFHYTLLPHTENWQSAGTVRKAAELNQCPVALFTTAHPGSLPLYDSYGQVTPDNLIVSALKQAEDSHDLILRCYETAGQAVDGVITLPKFNRVIQAHFNPGEIKTFRIPKDASQPVIETNLLEWDKGTE